MRILSLILVLAIAASAMGANKMPALKKVQQPSCCKSHQSHDQKHNNGNKKNDCGACLMVCCRIVTAPVDTITTPLDESPLAARIVLPPLLVNDLGEPQSIFHPPRA